MAKRRQKKKRARKAKKALTLTGKGLDLSVGGGATTLEGKGFDLTVEGGLEGKGFDLTVGDAITAELQRIEKMPPGPARDAAFEEAKKQFQDEIVRADTTPEGQ